jgi:hypothetical protein
VPLPSCPLGYNVGRDNRRQLVPLRQTSADTMAARRRCSLIRGVLRTGAQRKSALVLASDETVSLLPNDVL